MGLFNLLSSDVGISFYGPTFTISLNWIGELIRKLIGAVGSVGVGIILFSIILKVIVMPFDVHQRITMRRQNIKMKENQAKMEKLQKQYANNKEMYNQKLMEMYKESGMSMFSSCLPMILSMVIFIVAINAFNAYSQFSNVENYNIMVKKYNDKIAEYTVDLSKAEYSLDTVIDGEQTSRYVIAKEDGKCIYLKIPHTAPTTDGDLKEYVASYTGEKLYYIDVNYALQTPEVKATADKALQEAKKDENFTDDKIESVTQNAVKGYFTGLAQSAVIDAYNDEVIENTKFLWIKNIWATDASYKHPVLDYTSFKQEVEREKFNVNGAKKTLSGVASVSNAYDELAYNTVTAKLTTQKNQANGYYVLIALSIGTILLQQWVSNRSQKEQQQFSSVDGQAASQQKMTMVIMTGMFAIFAFMYSSAFSIYMIMSNVLSLGSTLVINKIVDVVESKKEEKEMQARYNKRFPGRVSPEQKAEAERKAKEKAEKEQKKAEKKENK